jgi:predicted transglutaminase-like cysteine proteinase
LVSTSAVGDNKPSLRELDLLNAGINQQIKYMTDLQQYGVADWWVDPAQTDTRYGDCEDYVLAKRSVLIEQGYGDYVSIATAWVRGEGYHAVLVVQAQEGEYVLDNLHRLAHKKQDLGYNWHLIQKGKRWYKIVN